MQRSPKKPGNIGTFWISMFLTLAIIMPLLGCFVIYSGWQGKMQAKAAQKSQSGVPIQAPGAEQDINLLVAVARKEPAFVLIRLNAPKAELKICTVPGESVLHSPTGPVLLEESYQAAGPGRAAELLSKTLDFTIDRYLALTPESMDRIWLGLEPPRVNLTGLLSGQELGGLGLKDDPVIALKPQDVDTFINQLRPGVVRRARLQAAVWEAALRQQLQALPQTIKIGLQKENSRLLGNISAMDYLNLEKTLNWLAKQDTTVEAQPLPGHYDKYTGRYEFDTDSLAFVKENLAKPADRQIKEPAELAQIREEDP